MASQCTQRFDDVIQMEGLMMTSEGLKNVA